MMMMEESDFLSCCGSTKFAKAMMAAGPFSSFDQALRAANGIWFNDIDINGWLEAFAAHPQIGDTSSSIKKTETSAEWSKGEQSTAVATATKSTLQELFEWNARYREKFGFVFLICASGRSTPDILAELKFVPIIPLILQGCELFGLPKHTVVVDTSWKRFPNKPIVELEIAAREQMKVTELRLAKLFAAKGMTTSPIPTWPVASFSEKAKEDRVGVIGAHLAAAAAEASASKEEARVVRTRPPITTHVLDVSCGSPAAGMEVQLEMWKGTQERPSLRGRGLGEWVLQGSSVTDSGGRSGALMGIVDDVTPGFYRISFNTGKYSPAGFFPYVSIVFEIKEFQRMQHFHVPLLLSPFSFSTYRGS